MKNDEELAKGGNGTPGRTKILPVKIWSIRLLRNDSVFPDTEMSRCFQ